MATAGLSPRDIAQPIRHVLRGSPDIDVLLAEASRVDLGARRVVLTDGDLAYDYLILATGASHAYFGHEDWMQEAPGPGSCGSCPTKDHTMRSATSRATASSGALVRAEAAAGGLCGGFVSGSLLHDLIAECHHCLLSFADWAVGREATYEWRGNVLRAERRHGRVVLLSLAPHLLAVLRL